MKPTVVFLHGMARTHRSLGGLRAHIEKAGYPTWARSYPSRTAPIQELASEVAGWINEDVDGPIVGVTHSMGGVLARYMATMLRWQGLIMLAPPNTGSRVAHALKEHPLYQWFYGPAGQELADPTSWPAPPKPFAVIAGTRGPTMDNPSSWAIAGLKLLPAGEPNDGTVTVAETKLDGLAYFAEVDASHTWLVGHPQTRALILRFLASGSF